MTMKTTNRAIPADEKGWMAEDDMRTLARAQEVMADPRRLAAAKLKAKEKLAELQSVASLGATKK
jgi:hypothetical protein